jgi:hypothetical protein
MNDATKNPMEAFHTRAKANDGIRVPLYLPTGEKSEHWIEIYGVDSDAFRLADAASRREGFKIAQLESQEARDKATAALTCRLRSKLVKNWSFDMECTEENVYQFLEEAPQIGDAIDRTASSRSVFFGIGSLGSSPTPSSSSSSTSPQKAVSKANAKVSNKSPSKPAASQKS